MNNSQGVKPYLVLMTVAFLGFLTSPASSEEICHLYTPYGYQRMGGAHRIGPYSSSSQCRSVNSQYFKGQGRCDCETISRPQTTAPPASSRPSYGGGRYPLPQYESPGSPEPTVDLEQQQREEDERRRQREEEERQRQAALERQRQEQFIRERNEAARTLRGAGSGFFGIRGNPEGDLQIKDTPPERETRSLPTAWQQLHCAGTIAQATVRAGKNGDTEEVRYLGEEVMKALNGDPLGVPCPANVPDPPKPYGQRQLSQHSPALVQLYTILIKSTEEATARLSKAQKRLPELREKKKATEGKVNEKKREVKQIDRDPVDIKKPEEVKAKKSALAEALAALKAAQAADADADKALREASKAIEQSRRVLERNQEMLEKAEADPDQAAQLLSQFQNSGRSAGR